MLYFFYNLWIQKPKTKNQKPSFLHKYVYLFIYQAPIVQTLDSAIHRINHYPAKKYYGNQLYAIRWLVIYPVDSAIQRLDNQGQKYNILSTEDSTRHFSTI